jgi:hypothetical protein
VGTIASGRDLRLPRTLVAFCCFAVVEYGIWVAVLLYAYQRGGAGLAGAVSVLQLLPAALLAPALGSVGDRLPRGSALCGAYAVEALTLLATGLLLLADAPLATIVVAGAAVTTTISVARPIHYASLPQLARSASSLVSANSLSGVLDAVGVFVGPVLAGVVAGVAGPGWFAVGAACGLVVSAACTLRLHLPRSAESEHESGSSQFTEAVLGVRVVARDPSVLGLLLLVGVSFFITGALEVLGVSFSYVVLDGGDQTAGLLVGATGIGALLGAAAAAGLAFRARLATPTSIGLVVAGVPLVLLAGVAALGPAVALLALCGVGQAFTGVAGRTLLQRATDDRVLARVFSVQEGVLLLGLAGGAATAPLLVRAFGAAGAYVPLGLGLLVVATIAWPALRRLDVRALVRLDVLLALRHVAFLAPMPPAALGRLSQNAEWIEVSAGTDVIVQGEGGDAFYVVGEGQLSVRVDGILRQHTLGPGDAFGEIALLRDVPRTATITATRPSRLLRIHRDDFLAAVTGSADGRSIAEEVAAARLASDRELSTPE